MTLALLHTSHVLIPTFNALCAQHLTGVEVFHLLDESLLKNTIKAGRLEKQTIRRVARHVESAHEAGADAVLVTCSSIGPAATAAGQLFDFPVLRIDEAMAERAVQLGARIGVLATLPSTLEPTMELVRATATAAGRDVEVTSRLCDGAFAAVSRGDTESHDRIVREGLTSLLGEVDVVVLAQASMARVAAQLSGSLLVKAVLSSPELAVLRTKSVLDGLGLAGQRR